MEFYSGAIYNLHTLFSKPFSSCNKIQYSENEMTLTTYYICTYIHRYICTMHIHFDMHNHKDVADLPDEDNVVGVSEAVKCYIYVWASSQPLAIYV